MSKQKIDVMLTAFRDGFQSVFGGRVLTHDFLPAVSAVKEAGITHFESGGGAMFQSLFFYCNENAFEAMDKFRETVGADANLQTLSRGVNVVGLDSQPSDIINLHAKLFKKHGVTTIRNFDALNDADNLIYSGKCIKSAGLKHEVCIALMSLPPNWEGAGAVHTTDYYIGVLKKILNSGMEFDSLCFKDASGTAVPSVVYTAIKEARKILPGNIDIRFHSHETAGTGLACYVAAVNAGADGIDLSISPVSGGTCQPDIISMWHALRGTDYDLGLDIDKIIKAEEIFKDCMRDYFVPPEAKAVEPLIPFSPMPGGALTANTQMLRDNGIMNKYPSIIKEMGSVVKLGGFGTSVTPVSQFYFQQAFNNVMFGEWKKIAEGYGKMVLGYFGKTPVPADEKIIKIASKQLGLEPANKTPLELDDANPAKGITAAKKMLIDSALIESDENIFIAATCKEKGIAFLKGKGEVKIRKISPKEESNKKTAAYSVRVNDNKYSVKIVGNDVIVDNTRYAVDVKPSDAPAEAVMEDVKEKINAVAIKSPLPGVVIRIKKRQGDSINKEETILVMEAMKMEVRVKSTTEGVMGAINVNVGDQIPTGHILAWVKGKQ